MSHEISWNQDLGQPINIYIYISVVRDSGKTQTSVDRYRKPPQTTLLQGEYCATANIWAIKKGPWLFRGFVGDEIVEFFDAPL